MDFGWSARAHHDQTVCTVAGEIDVCTAGSMERAGCHAMDAHGPCLVLDLWRVTFMDASGITALIRLRKEALERGGFLRLDRVPARVQHVLTITGTAGLFGAGRTAGLFGAGRPGLIDLSGSATRSLGRSRRTG